MVDRSHYSRVSLVEDKEKLKDVLFGTADLSRDRLQIKDLNYAGIAVFNDGIKGVKKGDFLTLNIDLPHMDRFAVEGTVTELNAESAGLSFNDLSSSAQLGVEAFLFARLVGKVMQEVDAKYVDGDQLLFEAYGESELYLKIMDRQNLESAEMCFEGKKIILEEEQLFIQVSKSDLLATNSRIPIDDIGGKARFEVETALNQAVGLLSQIECEHQPLRDFLDRVFEELKQIRSEVYGSQSRA